MINLNSLKPSMMKTLITFILINLMEAILLPCPGFSQAWKHQCCRFEQRQKKWNVSLFGGSSRLGPGRDLEIALISAGFGDEGATSEGWLMLKESGPSVSYKNYPVWKLILSHQLGVKTWLTFSTGNSWSQTVTGKVQVGWNLNSGHPLNNLLSLNSVGRTISIQYEYHPWRKSRSGFALGPALVFHQVKQLGAENAYRQRSVLPGIDAGGQVSIIHSKSWLLLVKAGYQWFPKDHLATILVNDSGHNPLLASTATTSPLKGAAVSIQSLNMGISLGIKL